MKIVLVAGDFAQSEVLKLLGARLMEAGHTAESFLCYGKKDQFNIGAIRQAIFGADWLVAGMSELSGEETAAVAEAVRHGTRIALYADTFGAYRLPAFEFARGLELTMFVVNAEEATDARRLFPRTDVRVTGNPRWEEFAFPKLSRIEARKKLGIADGRRVILCVGDKYLAQNMIQFGATIDAVHMLGWRDSADILLALHPGDLNDPKLYDELVVNAGCPVRIIGRHVGINTGEILVGCDLLVEFTSTIGIQAACLRIPVIDFCSAVALRGKDPTDGVSPWKLTEKGAAVPVHYGSSDELANWMEKLLLHVVTVERIQNNQKRTFPVPSADARGLALKLMCEALVA